LKARQGPVASVRAAFPLPLRASCSCPSRRRATPIPSRGSGAGCRRGPRGRRVRRGRPHKVAAIVEALVDGRLP